MKRNEIVIQQIKYWFLCNLISFFSITEQLFASVTVAIKIYLHEFWIYVQLDFQFCLFFFHTDNLCNRIFKPFHQLKSETKTAMKKRRRNAPEISKSNQFLFYFNLFALFEQFSHIRLSNVLSKYAQNSLTPYANNLQIIFQYFIAFCKSRRQRNEAQRTEWGKISKIWKCKYVNCDLSWFIFA